MNQVDELVPMGKCANPQCGKEWSMTVGEKQFFDRKIAKMKAEGNTFRMPTHCRECRNAKKGNRISPEQIIGKVGSMARKAEEGHYSFEDEVLAKDLQNVLKMLKAIFPKNRRGNVQAKEAVAQPPESGDVQAES